MGALEAPQWLLSGFVRSVQAAGGTAQPEEIRSTGESLLERWSSPERRFHNLKHLLSVLSRVDELTEETHEPDLVRLAAWYHGAVFASDLAATQANRGGEDEEASADVALRDLTRATHVRYINPDARCVQWHNPRMLTEELQSPGIAEVYAELMTHGGGNTYSVTLPAGTPTVPFGEWQTGMGRRHAATIIAVRTPDALLVGPAWDAPVPAASVLYYVGRYRLTDKDELRANVTNLTDKRYYDAIYRSGTPFSFVAPGRQATVSVSVTL